VNPEEFAAHLRSAPADVQAIVERQLNGIMYEVVRRARRNQRKWYKRHTGNMYRSIKFVPVLITADGAFEGGVRLDAKTAFYALVHEGRGKVLIRPKRGKYLRIPLNGASYSQGKYWVLHRPGRNPLLMPIGGGPPEHVLVKSVTLTKRPYVTEPFEWALDEIPEALGGLVEGRIGP